ncbi:MAG: hypothetical protein JHC55_08200 [Mycolicibacterium sp.]|nr:hypothetical protein [Mycolicibacterium sp.]
MTEHAAERRLRRLTTPRSAAVAGVLFGLIFGTVLVLIRLALPEGAVHGSQWASGHADMIRLATILMPFAGITFLWFIGVVRDGFGTLEDKFFSSVFLGSGLLFLAMMFAAAAVGKGLAAGKRVSDEAPSAELAVFGQTMVTTLSNTYALRMAAVFMMSLATIWLKTRLMPTWLVVSTYLAAVAVLIASDVSPWITLVFPVWVLVVSLAILSRRVEVPTPDRV